MPLLVAPTILARLSCWTTCPLKADRESGFAGLQPNLEQLPSCAKRTFSGMLPVVCGAPNPGFIADICIGLRQSKMQSKLVHGRDAIVQRF